MGRKELDYEKRVQLQLSLDLLDKHETREQTKKEEEEEEIKRAGGEGGDMRKKVGHLYSNWGS